VPHNQPTGVAAVVDSNPTPIEARVRLTGFAAEKIGEWDMGNYTGRRRSHKHDEIAQLAFSLYELRADRTAIKSKDCVQNRNSCGTTRISEGRTNSHDASSGVGQTKG
jgi:hypothetical protein